MPEVGSAEFRSEALMPVVSRTVFTAARTAESAVPETKLMVWTPALPAISRVIAETSVPVGADKNSWPVCADWMTSTATGMFAFVPNWTPCTVTPASAEVAMPLVT